MDELSGTSLTLISAVSFILSCLCSLAKSAHLNFAPAKLETILSSENEKARLANFTKKSSHILICITLLGTMANTAFVIGTIMFFAEDGKIQQTNLFLGFTLAFFPLLIFAKAIPEAFARLQPERTLMSLFPLLFLSYALLFWLTWPIYRVVCYVEKKWGKRTILSTALVEKEILHVISQGEEQGLLQEDERSMISSVIRLKECEVKEILTPRTDMLSIPIDTNIGEAINFAAAKGYSRIPVYKETRDEIVGILYVKDLLSYWNDEKRNELSVQDIIRIPHFVPETIRVTKLFSELRRQKLSIAVVLDEYGGISGVVTIEDILEEIVGDILDEYDRDNLDPIRFIDENLIEVDASLHVDDVNETLQMNLPSDEGYETIGGFLFASLGHIPKKNERYRHGNIEFIVVETTERRIKRIQILRHGNEEQPA